MNIVIIEDEKLMAEDLRTSIAQLIDEQVSFVLLHSVKEAVTYLKKNAAPDLIFSDIQLGDGLSFEIFIDAPVAAPVIFCTAYDEYALDAFKVNGIDYILKPFTTNTLEAAIRKYTQLKGIFSESPVLQYKLMMDMLKGKEKPQSASILVYSKDKIIPVKLEDVALFYLENQNTHLLTFSGKILFPNKNLDELEKVCGNYFFRANRQILVCRNAIIDVSSFFSRKLSVNLSVSFKERVIVSKGKAAQFLEWLANT